MYSRIVLIGFPGSGKSTIGKKLAHHLNFTFFDVDQYFEEKNHITIPNFFKKYGEEIFRKTEHLILKELLQKEHIVISTGGGTPCFYGNMDLILENSLSVYIKMAPISLLDRLSHSKKVRPLIKDKTPDEIKEFIENLLPLREKFYRTADVIIKGENLDFDHLLTLVS